MKKGWRELLLVWFQNGKAPIKITETTVEFEELRSRLEAEKKMRQDVEKELELQVDINSKQDGS